jgi:hypothetical protein
MTAAEIDHPSSRRQPRLGPYSRKLQRGAIADLYDGRSAEGRFIRHLEAELVAHVGGSPSITERLLIERLIKIRLQLDLLDTKLAKGEWTGHDSRTYGGLLNAYRLHARELGLRPAAAKPLTILERIMRDRGPPGPVANGGES